MLKQVKGAHSLSTRVGAGATMATAQDQLVSAAATGPFGRLARPVGYALLMILATSIVLTLHELTHIVTGRAVGVSAVLMSPSAAGLAPGSPAPAAWQLLVFALVAPLLTMIAGVVLLPFVTRSAAWLPAPLGRFLGWATVVALPYVGVETYLIGSYGDIQGNGADFSVAALVLGFPSPARAVIAAVGVAVYFTVGFWLRFPLAAVDGATAVRRLHLGAPFGAVPLWRRVVALVLLAAMLALVVLGLVQFSLGIATGVKFIAYGTIMWSVGLAVGIPWRAPGAASLWRNWIGPGLLGGIVMFVFGTLTETDYQNFPLIMLAALFSAAWAQSAAACETARSWPGRGQRAGAPVGAAQGFGKQRRGARGETDVALLSQARDLQSNVTAAQGEQLGTAGPAKNKSDRQHCLATLRSRYLHQAQTTRNGPSPMRSVYLN
ncbi:MAG: hypothetical protein M3069_31675 [Chloroflexota bacterium]|nr:hypothetical protein [Chloroflexota bacterium]